MIFGHFGAFSSQFLALFLSKFSPKTHTKTFEFLLFSNNQVVVFLLSSFSPWFQNLGFEVWGVQMYLFSYYLYPFNFLHLSCFIVLSSIFYSLSSMSTFFLTCFITLLLLSQPSRARIYLNSLFFAQIYMFRSFLPCFCLDLHVQELFAQFLLKSTCLGAFCLVFAQTMCLCASCHVFVFGSTCYA